MPADDSTPKTKACKKTTKPNKSSSTWYDTLEDLAWRGTRLIPRHLGLIAQKSITPIFSAVARTCRWHTCYHGSRCAIFLSWLVSCNLGYAPLPPPRNLVRYSYKYLRSFTTNRKSQTEQHAPCYWMYSIRHVMLRHVTSRTCPSPAPWSCAMRRSTFSRSCASCSQFCLLHASCFCNTCFSALSCTTTQQQQQQKYSKTTKNLRQYHKKKEQKSPDKRTFTLYDDEN